ncbi:NRAMP family divalent metal transporter [Clostridium estertheticum]|uniref:NRAMP family divalent metal transporter n=1 Tax=Clostridium estertheticum TaxID=238834 RepID=UPI001C0E8E1D|nr:NRAMP family divalent metal transporter [Clostridium estertheticum]MBU3186185.1 divalent metal cation transporter [Clostridium estertheticum]
MSNNLNTKDKKKSNIGVLIGAAFIMATSAIGPGFLTQTAVFTESLKANLGFVILLVIIIDLIAQLNIWQIIGVSGLRAQDIANKMVPGLGVFLAVLITIGGFAFCIGNISGAALGLNVLFGLNTKIGAIISCGIGIIVFSSKEAGKAMDIFAKVLGIGTLLLVAYVAFRTHPPVGEMILRTFVPTKVTFLPLLTLVGGTVGGYICFSGGHRLIDAGITGEEHVKEITKSSVLAISLASLMRILLFAAILGVVVNIGKPLGTVNPAAEAFRLGAGNLGYKLFGVILFSAGLTAMVGSSYTTLSFLKTLAPVFDKHTSKCIIGFITICTLVFLIIGKPVKLLVLAGSLNGLILPISLGIILIASTRKNIVGDHYKHSKLLMYLGYIVVILAVVAGYMSLGGIAELFK